LPDGFLKIDKASFWMGSPGGCPSPEGYAGACTSEQGRDSSETLHYVKLTHDYEMMVYEVTQGGWNTAFGGWNPAGSSKGDSYPIEKISWFDACAYANWVSEQALLTPCYLFSSVTCDDGSSVGSNYKGCMNGTQKGIGSATVTLSGAASKPYACEGFRLPTGAEWEYAARAGSSTAFYPSAGNDGSITEAGCGLDLNLDKIGWYCGNNGPSGTKTVGEKAANSWGLKDMSGNVWEWCSDWKVTYPGGTQELPDVDPYGTGGSGRVGRGGSWYDSAEDSRSANRYSFSPGTRYDFLGFRLARSLEFCGDGACNAAETCDSCPGDCGKCLCEPGVSSGKKTAVQHGLVWVEIPAGCFMMGCSLGDGDCQNNEKPPHEVTVALFEILETEVTEAQWAAVVPGDPEPSCDLNGGGGSNSPVECIDWEEAKAFCEALDPNGRLCSEAEWEYAARGGTATKYNCGDDSGCLDDVAWYSVNSDDGPGKHKYDVKGQDPNGYGLYDMLGNVWEWVEDCWHNDYDLNSDGAGDWGVGYPAWTINCSGSDRGVRGGSFGYDDVSLRASNRSAGAPLDSYDGLGSRCCRSE